MTPVSDPTTFPPDSIDSEVVACLMRSYRSLVGD